MKVSVDNYHVYILTNKTRTVLYTGVTNDLPQRIIEHYLNRGNTKTFTGRYHCYLLIYYESFKYINNAIAREKEIKKYPRQKKVDLINSQNPLWQSLNDELFDSWPPTNMDHRKNM